MYENQLDFIKQKNNNSFSGVYYSDINNNDDNISNNNYNNRQIENYNYNIFNDVENKNNPAAYQEYLFINERNKFLKQNEINNEVYARNQHMDYPEQLDYMNQHSVNIFPDLKPTPLVYNGLTAESNNGIKKKIGKSAKNTKKSIGAKLDYNKNFLINLKNRMKNSKKNKLKNKSNPKHNIICLDKNCKDDEKRLEKRNLNFNTNIETKNNNKGLFDPYLKSNELDFPRKTVIQRLERIEKIKNYDVKFGSKVRKLEVYKNIVDMFEDLAFDREERDFKKKDKTIHKKNKTENQSENKREFNVLNYNLMHEDDTEDVIKENKRKYKTHLDFNFSHQEQMIKALEQQIAQERKLRAQVNFKYLQKMKELEENKIKDFIKLTAKSLSRSASRGKNRGNKEKNGKPDNILKVYLPQYDLIKEENSNNFKNKRIEIEKNKFKNNIDNSIDVLRKQNKLVDTRSPRAKSEEAMRKAIDEIKPQLDRVIEEDFQKIIKKNNLFKNRSRSNSKNKFIKKIYLNKNSKSGNTNNHVNQSQRISIDRNSEVSGSVNAYNQYSPRKLINNSYNAENVNYSKIDKSQREYEFNNQGEQFNNSSVLGNERLNNHMSNPEMNQNSLSLSNNVNQTHFKNIISPLFSSQNQELRVNHDLLLNNNFNNNSNYDIRDNSSPQTLNHEFIKSKILNRNLKNNTANYDVLIEKIIDDLLIENVFELQEIEAKQEKLKQKENMKSFIKEYYQNFDDIKKLEDNVFEKLHSNDYGIRLNPQNKRIVLDGKEDRRHIVYKNPFEAKINKSIDQINQNSLIIVEKEAVKNDKIFNNINTNHKSTLNSSSKNKNSNQSTSRLSNQRPGSKEKEKRQNKNFKKNNNNNEKSRSKSRESLKSPKEQSHLKQDNSDISKTNHAPKLIPDEDNLLNLQEKIKQNFMNHLIENDYNFNNIPVSDNNKKSYYVTNLHKNLPEVCEKYKKEYDDYMKTTGVFFVPNVFMLYEDVVNKLTDEIFEECISKSLKALDEKALNIVKEEVENKI